MPWLALKYAIIVTSDLRKLRGNVLEIPEKLGNDDFLPWFLANYDEKDEDPEPINVLNPAPRPQDVAAFRERIHTFLKIYGELDIEMEAAPVVYLDLSARVSLTALWRLVLFRDETVLLPGATEQEIASAQTYTRVEVWPNDANPDHYDNPVFRFDINPGFVYEDYARRTLNVPEFLALTLDVETALTIHEASRAV